MTKVYLGQQVRVIQSTSDPGLEGLVLYLDDFADRVVPGNYFVDGNPNPDDSSIAHYNTDYGWVEKIQAVDGLFIRRQRYFDSNGLRKRYERDDVLPYEGVLPYDVTADAEASEEAPQPDPVNHPNHYTSMPNGIECIDVIEWMNLCRGNAIKYIWRAGQKDPTKEVEDLEKAAWFLQREIDRLKRVQA